MKQISSWLALLTFAFWGTMGTVLLLRALTPATVQFAVSILLPTGVLLGLLVLMLYLRRRSHAHCGLDTLEEVRRKSRTHLAGEPEEGTCVVISPRTGGRMDCFEKESAGHEKRGHDGRGGASNMETQKRMGVTGEE